VASACPHLEFLGLDQCGIDDEVLQHIARLPQLKRLVLRMATLVSNGGLKCLADGAAGQSLIELDISHCGKITDEGLTYIPKMKEIRVLHLSGMMRITSQGVDVVCKGCPLLESLSISKCKLLDNAAIKTIFANVHNLVNLDMGFLSQITDEAFEQVNSSLSLVSLILGGVSQITDATVKRIALNARSLQVLNLWKCANITDEGVAVVAKFCPLLYVIQLSDCTRITDKSLFALASGCPRLTTAIFGGYSQVTDEGVKAITQQCKEIRTIDLGGLVSITNQSLAYLSSGCPNLYSVSLYDCKKLTVDGIYQLVGSIPNLKRIDLGGESGVTGQQVQDIKNRFAHLEIAV